MKGVWLYRVVYNDGESEEFWMNEILKYVNRVDNHDDDLMMVLIANCESSSDDDYKYA